MGQNCCACNMYSVGLLVKNIGDRPRGSTWVLPRLPGLQTALYQRRGRCYRCLWLYITRESCEGTCTLRYNYIIFNWYTSHTPRPQKKTIKKKIKKTWICCLNTIALPSWEAPWSHQTHSIMCHPGYAWTDTMQGVILQCLLSSLPEPIPRIIPRALFTNMDK